MSDSVPKLNSHRIVFHIADDEDWIKLKATDFITQPNTTIPMNMSDAGKGDEICISLDDSILRSAEAMKIALDEFDVKKVVQDAILSCDAEKSKKTWNDKGLLALLEKANSDPDPAADL